MPGIDSRQENTTAKLEYSTAERTAGGSSYSLEETSERQFHRLSRSKAVHSISANSRLHPWIGYNDTTYSRPKCGWCS